MVTVLCVGPWFMVSFTWLAVGWLLGAMGLLKVTHRLARGPALIHRVAIAGLPKAAKKDKLQHTSSFQASIGVTSANVPLSKACYMSKPRFKEDLLEKETAKSIANCVSVVNAYIDGKNLWPFLICHSICTNFCS